MGFKSLNTVFINCNFCENQYFHKEQAAKLSRHICIYYAQGFTIPPTHYSCYKKGVRSSRTLENRDRHRRVLSQMEFADERKKVCRAMLKLCRVDHSTFLNGCSFLFDSWGWSVSKRKWVSKELIYSLFCLSRGEGISAPLLRLFRVWFFFHLLFTIPTITFNCMRLWLPLFALPLQSVSVNDVRCNLFFQLFWLFAFHSLVPRDCFNHNA